MVDTIKVLGQTNPSATTLTNLYIVPASKSATISSVTICNTGSDATTFRISIAIGGEADSPKQYLYYDLPIPANDTFIATIGVTLATTDIVRVYGGNDDLSFNLFGVEVS